MKPLSISTLSILVIVALLAQMLSPVVEASVIYGPSQYRGDRYRDPVSNGDVIVNGSPQVVNGSGQANINGIPVDRNALSNFSSMGMGRPDAYTGQFNPSDNGGPAFDEYKRLTGQYRPDMRFENAGGIRLNKKSGDDAGSSLVFEYLDKYVQRDNRILMNCLLLL